MDYRARNDTWLLYRSASRYHSVPSANSSRDIWRIINIFPEDSRGSNVIALAMSSRTIFFFFFLPLIWICDIYLPVYALIYFSWNRKYLGNSYEKRVTDCESHSAIQVSLIRESPSSRSSRLVTPQPLLRASSQDFYYVPPLLIMRDLPALTHTHHGVRMPVPLCQRARVTLVSLRA